MPAPKFLIASNGYLAADSPVEGKWINLEEQGFTGPVDATFVGVGANTSASTVRPRIQGTTEGLEGTMDLLEFPTLGGETLVVPHVPVVLTARLPAYASRVRGHFTVTGAGITAGIFLSQGAGNARRPFVKLLADGVTVTSSATELFKPFCVAHLAHYTLHFFNEDTTLSDLSINHHPVEQYYISGGSQVPTEITGGSHDALAANAEGTTERSNKNDVFIAGSATSSGADTNVTCLLVGETKG